MKRALKIAGYGAWFLLSFVVGIYLTFPVNDIKPILIAKAEEALGKGKQGQYGVDPQVQIGDLSLSRIGVKAKHVSVQLPSRDPDPGPTIDLDDVRVGVGLFSLLSATKTVTFSADAFGGSVDGTVDLDDKGVLHEADIDVDDVDLAKVNVIQQRLGVPMTGKVNVGIELDFGPTPEKDGTGDIKIDAKNVALQGGTIKPALGATLAGLDLGTISGEIPIKQGKGTLQNVKVEGKDVQAEAIGEIAFRGRIGTSRFDVDGWFLPTPSFLEREKTVADLLRQFQDASGLSRAKDDEGHYYFQLKGSLQQPTPALARDNGKRAKQRVSKAAGGSPAPTPTPTPTPPDSEG